MSEPRKPWLRSGERNALRWVAVGTMLFLTAVVALVVWQTRDDGTGAGVQATPSPSPQPTPTVSPTEIALPEIAGIPKEGTSVLVVVEGKMCWRGYVGGTKIQHCGKQRIDLTGVPNKIKAGAQLRKNEDGYFLEVYIVHEGEAVAFGDAGVSGELVEVRANLSG